MGIDDIINIFDKGLKTLAGPQIASRQYPGRSEMDAELSDADRRHSAALMRVNHSGEVCAQALYQGQALATNDDALKSSFAHAAAEEADHLAWSERRIQELGGNTSALNPVWYAGSFAMGFLAGKAGDRWNLAFLEETERQVEKHLQGHLERLHPGDNKTREVIAAMKVDEVRHGQMAHALGARELPDLVKKMMRCASKVMTRTSYYI